MATLTLKNLPDALYAALNGSLGMFYLQNGNHYWLQFRGHSPRSAATNCR